MVMVVLNYSKVQLLELGHELPDYTTGASFYQPIADVIQTLQDLTKTL